LEAEIPFNNDKMEGICKMFDENGKLRGEIPTNNDKAEGISKEY